MAATPISPQEMEKKCLEMISIAMEHEKDVDKSEMENAGRSICKWMTEQTVNPRILRKAMTTAIRAIPTYTVAREKRKKLELSE